MRVLFFYIYWFIVQYTPWSYFSICTNDKSNNFAQLLAYFIPTLNNEALNKN